ncbi:MULTISPECIES: DNA repair protein RecN [Corynebacterium]|uniref:DNA repair protein RecN n=1 Tax=Corynebacterium TaxID=1716 RepID=UPI00124EC4C1|nr:MULTISPECIES: DNA repair protein RecN [Corynebacterium]
MLAELAINNVGVIPSESVEFSGGLSVLTGETGAGKTMVVFGLRMLAGDRADASRVRSGASEAAVEGRFSTAGMASTQCATVEEIVSEAGGARDENEEFIATRVIKSTGRSRAHLGGRSVPAATLKHFAGEMLAIHGQNDQLRLVSPEHQRAALDRSDEAIAPLLATYTECYTTWRTLARDLAQRTASRREMAQEVDRLQFAINEINTVDPQPGEDTELQAMIRRLQDVDTLREQAQNALVALDGMEALGDGGFDEQASASDLLGEASGALAGSEDPDLSQLAERLEELTSQLGEISGELGMFLSTLPSDPQALEESLQRQQDLKSLTRKYAPDIAGVLAWKTKAEAKLASIDTSPEALEELKKKVARAEKKLTAAAKKLSAARARAATALEQDVTAEIRGLAMPKAEFVVSLEACAPTPHGAETVEFRLAAHPGASPQPIANAASGGELSRVMLALEVVVAQSQSSTTLVFDEVDAGVGGRAAVEIGRRLARLAQRNQVIVVTHLPQVAAYADQHLHVSKDVSDSSVTSAVEDLAGERRVEELARMLAGLDDTETGKAHATELLATAARDKEGFLRG